MARILVVDDEPDISNAIRAGLRKKGFDVDAYTDAVDALARYVPGAYDLLILDIMMPKMSGFSLLEEIRKRDPDVRFFFLTAFDIYPNEAKSLLSGKNAHRLLRKPMMIGELARHVSVELEQSRKKVVERNRAT